MANLVIVVSVTTVNSGSNAAIAVTIPGSTSNYDLPAVGNLTVRLPAIPALNTISIEISANAVNQNTDQPGNTGAGSGAVARASISASERYVQ